MSKGRGRVLLAGCVALTVGLAGGCAVHHSEDGFAAGVALESLDDVVGCWELGPDLHYVDHGGGTRRLGVDVFGVRTDDELTARDPEQAYGAAARRGWDRRSLDVLMGPSSERELADWLDIPRTVAASELRRVEVLLARTPTCELPALE